MDMMLSFGSDLALTLVGQFQKPTLAFLIGGMALAALGSKLEVPAPVYKFIVLTLLLKIGMSAGVSVRRADPLDLIAPALGAAALGVLVVVIGGRVLGRQTGVSKVDALATAGLFGAVSASTLAAAMAMLDAEGIAYEGFVGALYPFMDIAALVTAIVLARLSVEKKKTATNAAPAIPGAAALIPSPSPRPAAGAVFAEIAADSLRSPAISALLLGIVLGATADVGGVLEGFYDPMFKGLLSILMLVMGMEAWARLSELRRVAHVYALYAIAAPLLHGLAGLALGIAIHAATGFSAGGVVLLAVMAASSSDISGPPTLRAALPEANASAYLGASTGIGTPVAILSIPLFIALTDALIGI